MFRDSALFGVRGFTALGLLLLAGCVAATDDVDEGFDESLSDSDVGEASQELQGSQIDFDESCPTDAEWRNKIEDSVHLGRVVSRAPIFAECVDRLMRERKRALGYVQIEDATGTTQWVPGYVGPYRQCDGTFTDPLVGDASDSDVLQRQIARVINVSTSPLRLSMFCKADIDPKTGLMTPFYDAETGTITGGTMAHAGSAGVTLANDRERFTWISDVRNQPPPNIAAVIWHEVMHDYGYGHPGKDTDPREVCGYTRTTTRSDPTVAYNEIDEDNLNQVTNIVGSCMTETWIRTALWCGSAAPTDPNVTGCRAGEILLPKEFYEPNFGDILSRPTVPVQCECVPDGIGRNESGDLFGSALAEGDFDNDGFDDLVVAAPGEDAQEGHLYVLHGSPAGLKLRREVDSGSEFGMARGDSFGKVMVAGDLNGDEFADLAVGAPNRDAFYYNFFSRSLGVSSEAGSVVIVLGSEDGLDFDSSTTLVAPFFITAGAHFGTSLAIGDFDNDGKRELAVGAPDKLQVRYSNQWVDAGAVYLFERGSSGGFAYTKQLEQGTLMSPGHNEEGDAFGHSLAAADFDNDGKDDLAIGAPYENGTGNVFVVTKVDASKPKVQRLYCKSSEGQSCRGAQFGWSLAAGLVDWGAGDDLVIGAPKQRTTGGATSGAVHIVRGGSSMTAITPITQYPMGPNQSNDGFGTSLALTENGSLMIGAPLARWGGLEARSGILYYAWIVDLLVRNQPTLSLDHTWLWAPEDDAEAPVARYTHALVDGAETRLGGARLGTAVVVGDFNGDGHESAAVGVPLGRAYNDLTESIVSSGVVYVMTPDDKRVEMRIDQLTTRYGDVPIWVD